MRSLLTPVELLLLVKLSCLLVEIFFQEAPQSLGVRMALGETQIVAETRDFLTENGVVLDSFSQVVMNFNG